MDVILDEKRQNGGDDKCIQNFCGETSLEMSTKQTVKVNNKRNLRETGYENRRWMKLYQERV
jgi:hypothetical protein